MKDSVETPCLVGSEGNRFPFSGNLRIFRVFEVQEVPYDGTEAKEPQSIIVEDRLGNETFDNRPA